jgi:hypothetical protein
MRTPPFVVSFRLLTVVISLTIIALVALGTVGLGPLAGVLGPSGPKIVI